MHSKTILVSQLTTNDISSILNLICPHCGGPLGGASQEFKCQGLCRTDWRPAWDDNRRVMIRTKFPRRRRSGKNGLGQVSSKRRSWRRNRGRTIQQEGDGDQPLDRH
jgi:hypothetical protein